MKIWAHRGCSQRYPENTEISFRKAAEIKGLEGIELDVQLTKDGEMVVIHDERVDRTTDGIGFVKDFTLKEIKELSIKTEDYRTQKILKMEEAVDLHPFWRDIDIPAEELKGYKVRAWMSGHLYPEKPTGKRLNLKELESKGITDIILNEPEVYL